MGIWWIIAAAVFLAALTVYTAVKHGKRKLVIVILAVLLAASCAMTAVSLAPRSLKINDDTILSVWYHSADGTFYRIHCCRDAGKAEAFAQQEAKSSDGSVEITAGDSPEALRLIDALGGSKFRPELMYNGSEMKGDRISGQYVDIRMYDYGDRYADLQFEVFFTYPEDSRWVNRNRPLHILDDDEVSDAAEALMRAVLPPEALTGLDRAVAARQE